MDRRELLRGAAALPLLALPALPSPEAAAQEAARRAPRRGPAPRPRAHLARVRPGDPGWPSEAGWQKLNDSVGGNLLKVLPLFEPCRRQPDEAACRDVHANIHNPFFIGDLPAGTEVSGWLDAWTPSASVYAVQARNTADVVAGVNFAREHDLRLVVKGTGHSYLGTSNAPDSLLIWTRAMNAVRLHDAFVPEGCAGKVQPLPAVSAAAGAMWIDLYHAVTQEAGRYVQGGGCTTVGVAGLVQSGGFGSCSKGFGTAASGLLEAEIVTADGRVRTVNSCSDPDLYWAIRGGGGGSWGVITRVTLQTHELPEFFGAAWGSIQAQSAEAFRRLLTHSVDFYAQTLRNPHWGEQITVKPENTLKLSMVCQGLDPQQTRAVWQPFFDWVRASPADFKITDELGAGALAARDWWTVGKNRSLLPDKRAGVPPYHAYWEGDQGQVGAFLHGYDSLWLPDSLLEPGARARLIDALIAASHYKEVELHFNKGLSGAPEEAIRRALDTATHPGVVRAFALAIIADGEGAAYPGMAQPAMDLEAAHRDARAIERATAELRQVAPDAGSYVSESNFFNKRWQQDYWGEHYPRLRSVKKQYDPEGLFFVHHGVGSEDWSADGFTRLA
jgi:FAD/FMN-containing dehydrogenase